MNLTDLKANKVQSDLSDIVNKGNLFVEVKDYGAKGDGVTDDTVSLQTAIDNSYGKTLVFEIDKIYKVSSTLYLQSFTKINGNNSKIIVDNDWDTTKNNVLFYKTSANNNWTIEKLIIKSNITKTLINTLCLCAIMGANLINFNMVNFDALGNGTENSVYPFFSFNSNSNAKFKFELCDFNCTTVSSSGGCLWITHLSGNAFINIKNCNFYQLSRDEILGFEGQYSAKVVIENCNFHKDSSIITAKCSLSDCIVIITNTLGSAVNVVKDVEFLNCAFVVETTQVATSNYQKEIVVEKFLGGQIHVKYIGCTFDAKVQKFFTIEGSANNTNTLSIELYRKYLTNDFYCCKIYIDGTFINNFGANFSMYDCNVTCTGYFVNDVGSQNYFPAKYIVKNCEITSNYNYIFRLGKSLCYYTIMSNCIINCVNTHLYIIVKRFDTIQSPWSKYPTNSKLFLKGNIVNDAITTDTIDIENTF